MANPITRDALGRLLPGHSIRGGKSNAKLHAAIDKWFGDDTETCLAFLAGVLKGTEQIPARAPGKNEDAVSAALIPTVVPTIRERIQVAELIMAYRHGKPKESVEHSGTIDTSPPSEVVDYSKLSDSELAEIERITQKALSDRQIVTITPTKKDPTP